MKKYQTVAFDLDGTLTDPESGLTSAFAYALTKMGIKYATKKELRRFIGPPLKAELMSVYGLDDAGGEECVRLFREYFAVYGWWDNKLYPGVQNMLATLKDRGKTIVLATSKPEIFASKILRLFDIEKYFDFVGAATLNHTRVEKSDILSYALDAVNADRSSSVMVGDRKYDAIGAAEVGIDSIGVLYGHGEEAEIAAAGFTYTLSTVEDITKILL
ncbi:MAG: HAD hydrolase-like protein [Clostridia bacterium]|nr:HAD hydrolase-like protein [Clostridia bacterium]